MIDKMSNYILDNILIKGEKVESDEREILLFGITRIIEDIPKYAFLIIICAIFKMLPELLVAFLTTAMYKLFIGGVHARTNIECFIYSTLYFILPIILAKYILVPETTLNVIYALVFALSIYVIFKIAPADTDQVPIINKKLRKTLKICGFISIILLYILVLFALKNIVYKNIAIYVIALIDIMATKPAYKLLKCKHSYESDEYKEYFTKT